MEYGKNEMEETWVAETFFFTCHTKYFKTTKTWNNPTNEKMDPRTQHKWNPKIWLQAKMEIV
jgi:hypothetical protein